MTCFTPLSILIPEASPYLSRVCYFFSSLFHPRVVRFSPLTEKSSSKTQFDQKWYGRRRATQCMTKMLRLFIYLLTCLFIYYLQPYFAWYTPFTNKIGRNDFHAIWMLCLYCFRGVKCSLCYLYAVGNGPEWISSNGRRTCCKCLLLRIKSSVTVLS